MKTPYPRDHIMSCVIKVLRATQDLLGANSAVVASRHRTHVYWDKRRMRREGEPDAWKIGVHALREAGIVKTHASHETRFVTGISCEEACSRLTQLFGSINAEAPACEGTAAREETAAAECLVRANKAAPRRARTCAIAFRAVHRARKQQHPQCAPCY